jgi:hypothetical protein
MITYTVSYKRVEDKNWHSLNHIKADMAVAELHCRVFIDQDEVRYEIPFGCMFKFSKERAYAITEEEKQRLGKG